MNIRRVLSALVRVVVDEAEMHPEFGAKLREVLVNEVGEKLPSASGTRARSNTDAPKAKSNIKRAAHRRAPAMIDPIHFARQGEAALRSELNRLTLEQLLDVVAEFGMDPGKLVMKWKTSDRVIDRIVELSLTRAQKGSAFREQESDNSVEQ